MNSQSIFRKLKAMALLCTILLGIIALMLVINGVINRRIWYDTAHAIGIKYWQNFDLAIALGVLTFLASCLGGVGISLNGYGLIIIYIIFLLLLLVVHVIGMTYFLVIPMSSNLKTLDHKVRQMLPRELAEIERRYQCCGVEKYTDYFLIWKIFTDTEYPYRGQVDKLYTTARPFVKPGVTVVYGGAGDSYLPRRTTTDPGWFWGRKSSNNSELLHWWKLKEDKKPIKTKKAEPKPFDLTHIHFYSLSVTVKPKLHSYFPLDYNRNAHPITKMRYIPDSIYSFLKKYTFGFLRLITGALGHVFSNTEEGDSLIKQLVKWVYKTEQSIFSVVPQFIKDAFGAMFASLLWWTQIFWRAPWNMFKWWWGSGWDDLYWKYVHPRGMLLPFSCCKLPQIVCSGDPITTWNEGCVYKMGSRLRMDTYRLIASFGVSIIALFVNICVAYTLVMDVKDKFYY